HRVLPDRGAFVAHLVRARRAARLPGCEELRRLVDRIRLAGRRAGGGGLIVASNPGGNAKRRSKNMTVTDELLQANERFAEEFDRGGLPMPPARHVAVLACMDAR